MCKELDRESLDALESVFSVIDAHLFVPFTLRPGSHGHSDDCLGNVCESGVFEITILPEIVFSFWFVDHCNDSDDEAGIAVRVRYVT